MAALRDDARLRPYFDIAVDRFLTVPDPRLAVLQGTPRLFRAIRIRLTEAAGDSAGATGGNCVRRAVRSSGKIAVMQPLLS